MAEEIVFGVVEKIVTELGYLALKEIESAWGVNKELKDLHDTVSTIKALLLHAEEMQVNNPPVKEWLRRIKNVAYEAEDVIDEFSIEATHRKLLVQENPIKKVRYFVSSSNPILFRFKMAHRIKEINQTLTRIASQKSSLQLEARVTNSETRVPNSERVYTHSYVDESRIFGREVEKQKMVQLLLDFNGVDRITIIPIQGLGGIGKTTLAKLVYNDKQVDTHFKLKMWVCVSEKFDVDKVIESILESATKMECPKLKIDLLQSLLRKEINGNKFLLVLDDVWNEDEEKWDILKELLMGGASGSKIVVTTRSQKVASIMGTISTQPLLELSHDDCWNLFKQRAFEDGQEERYPNLVEIGVEIVRKCGGVPLAAKTLGSLLRLKTEEHDWLHVRNSDIWRLPQKENDILPALRLSYNHMPFSLRQCFAYCSLFPKGCTIDKWRLIFLWIAQGYIISSDGEYTLEEIGSQYVEELMWRSFFQDGESNYNETISFKMHDLVHDLAQSVARNECFTLKKDTNGHIPQEVRHLCIDDTLFPLKSLDIPGLRTLIFNSQSYLLNGVTISSLKLLRVLVLENYCDDYLPDSIGKLKHLRFLQIVSFSISKLPKSITKLQSLEYLNVWCEKLEELPKDLEKMIGLKSVVLRSDSSLTHMPKRIGKLVSLEWLPVFVVGKGIGSKLNELNGLRNLRGSLTIKNLENVGSSKDTTEINLDRKPKLVELELIWNEDQEGVDKEKTSLDVLENLQPHKNVRELYISGYEGARFANWMMLEEWLLPNLRHVTLSKCRKCQNLPSFGQLRLLDTLILEEMDALEFIESSRQGSNQKDSFPSLRELRLLDLPNLKGWLTKKEQPETSFLSLTCLIELTVSNCPKMTSIPLVPSLGILNLERCCDILVQSILFPQEPSPPESDQFSLPKLKDLTIKHINDLVSLPLRGLTSLEALEIHNCPSLTSFTEVELQGLSSLLYLQMSECESFTTLSAGMCYLTSLTTLFLQKLPKLLFLPEELQNSTKLQFLGILECEGIMNLPDGIGKLISLQTVAIVDCPNLKNLPEGMQFLTNLQRLEIGCDGLLSWPNWLGKLTSITELGISCSSDHLPEQLQHLTSLQRLHIESCVALVTLPEWIVNFSSLQHLLILDCPCLQYLPEQMKLLSRLKHLEIKDCNKLTSRCKKGTGQDWSKIAHVRTIILNKVTM